MWGGQVGVFQGRISLLKLSFPICRLQNRPGVVPGSRLPPASPSSSSSGGRSIPLSLPLPIAPCTTPPLPPRPLLQEVHCPGSPTSSRRWPPRPLPVRRVRRPAGTRLPIPYMDKCVQAKSGIQAPDVSLQRSGHRTGDRGEGVGRKEGESTNQQPLPACCRSFTFCLWVRSRGPLELSRDK